MMNTFRDTPAGAAFVASGDSRQTSREVMEAIAFFAKNEREAVGLWAGDGLGKVAHLSDIWEHSTKNGLISDDSLHWGDRSLAEIMADAE